MRRLPMFLATALAAALAVALAAVVASGQGSSTDKALAGSLSGANEIGENGRRGAGDRNARGSASAIIDGTQLCFGLTVKNTDEPVAAHIHRGTRNRNGGIVVTLEAPSDGDPGAESGCTDVSPSLARSLVRNPSRYYWNIHTEDFPGGSVRGQLRALSPR